LFALDIDLVCLFNHVVMFSAMRATAHHFVYPGGRPSRIPPTHLGQALVIVPPGVLSLSTGGSQRLPADWQAVNRLLAWLCLHSILHSCTPSVFEILVLLSKSFQIEFNN
jgi:hypothetical protein